MNCRGAAATVVASVIRQQGSLASLIPQHLQKLPPADQALFQDLCYGTLRWYPKIAAILRPLLSKPLKTKDADIQALLAIGIYQLTETRIPDHAALNETVAATKQLKKNWSKALVNGVLRSFLRRQPELEASLASSTAFKTAHPDWLVNTWEEHFPKQLDQLLNANNERAPMTLRVNQLQSSRANYLDLLEKANIAAKPTRYSSVGITLTTPTDVNQLPGFNRGLVSVQDEAAQLAGEIIGIQPGEHVLDACCAPGGKTCHLIEAADNKVSVVALDNDDKRLIRVSDNLTRLSLSASLLCSDATDTHHWWDGQPFDRILLDAPCSATGVIRRHPDIKLLRRPEDADKLSKIQLQMLHALWPLLKEKGRLLYATCSTLPQENEQVISEFLAQTKNARVLPLNGEWGISRSVGKQLLPEHDGHDGFYYAALEKQA